MTVAQALAASSSGFVMFARPAAVGRRWPESMADTPRTAAHVLMGHLLAGWLGRPGESVTIERLAGGRPALTEPNAPAISLAHTHDLVAVAAVTAGNVGVDVQTDDVRAPWSDIAPWLPEVFDARDADLSRRVQWCRREAVGKATGTGLVGPAALGDTVAVAHATLGDGVSGAWCWSGDLTPQVWWLPEAGPPQVLHPDGVNSTSHGRVAT